MIKPPRPLLLIQLNAEPTVAAEGNFYFLEYLEFKLFRYNLNSFIKFEREDDAIPDRFQQTSEKIQEICGLLEHLYPKLYVHVSRQLKITLRTEVIICDIFRCFCRTLFKIGISWPRIVALFAFASGLIVDCIREDRPEFARTVVYCVKAFIEDNLAGWVKEQDGWDMLETNQDASSVWHIIRLADYSSCYKHKTNYQDELTRIMGSILAAMVLGTNHA